jgi:hypothetical protein
MFHTKDNCTDSFITFTDKSGHSYTFTRKSIFHSKWDKEFEHN